MGKFTLDFCRCLANEYINTQSTTINKTDIEKWLNSELWENYTNDDIENIMAIAREIIINRMSK